MPTDVHTTVYGEKVKLRLLEQREEGKRAIDVIHDDGRKWRLVAEPSGDLDHVEATWRDGDLADVDDPGWLEDVLAELAAPA